MNFLYLILEGNENSIGINIIKRIKFMAKRVTIMLEEDLVKKLRDIQAKKIKDNNDSVSFSEVINEVLESQLKKK